MSLNTIQLQDFIVGELYKENLLTTADGTAAPAIRRPAAPEPVPTAPIAQQPTSPVVNTPPVTAAPATTPQPAATPPPEAAQPTTTPAEPLYKFLGNHRRKVTILVNAPGTPFLPDNQLSFLTKILEACRMNIGDVAIINHAAAPVNITALRAQLQPSFILLFGLEPTTIRLPINFPIFRLQPYDQCTYLSAPPLDQLVRTTEDAKLLKSKLWVCLKTLFEV